MSTLAVVMPSLASAQCNDTGYVTLADEVVIPDGETEAFKNVSGADYITCWPQTRAFISVTINPSGEAGFRGIVSCQAGKIGNNTWRLRSVFSQATAASVQNQNITNTDLPIKLIDGNAAPPTGNFGCEFFCIRNI